MRRLGQGRHHTATFGTPPFQNPPLTLTVTGTGLEFRRTSTRAHHGMERHSDLPSARLRLPTLETARTPRRARVMNLMPKISMFSPCRRAEWNIRVGQDRCGNDQQSGQLPRRRPGRPAARCASQSVPDRRSDQQRPEHIAGQYSDPGSQTDDNSQLITTVC
jgi:hypothetical protein